MSLRFLSADWIYPVVSNPVQHGVVVMDGDRVVEITSRSSAPSGQLETFNGILIPGFINAHCHLELSHLKGKLNTGTGLLPFLEKVVGMRDATAEEIQAAIQQQDRSMWLNGIQAVGDIGNKPDTFATKAKSNIRYYNFVELFDFLQSHLAQRFTSGTRLVFEEASEPKSLVPHAPYSVSPSLFDEINRINSGRAIVSIHNQETPEEEALFQHGTGMFFPFFQHFGFDLSSFQPFGASSIYYSMEHLDPARRTLFVHNTTTTLPDIEAAHRWSPHVYWVACPNANLYIENRLPQFRHFLETNARVTLGTDSLASNWQLSILEEMKTIARYQSYVPFEAILRWATLNGAEALGMESEFGSIEQGKRPGILLLTFDPMKGLLTDGQVKVERLI